MPKKKAVGDAKVTQEQPTTTKAPEVEKDDVIARICKDEKRAALILDDRFAHPPMFDLHSTQQVSYPPSQLIRYLFFKEHITEEYFKQSWWKRIGNAVSAKQTTSEYNNTKNRLKSGDEISWLMIDRCLTKLGLSLIDLQMTYMNNETGDIKTVSISELSEEISKLEATGVENKTFDAAVVFGIDDDDSEE